MAFTFVRGFSIFHSGIDLSAPRGTPIHAVNAGQVRFAGPDSSPQAPSFTKGGGNVVVIRVAGRDELYAHLDSVRTYTGATMPAGGVVGTVGATGNATGPHLHYAWWVNGRAVAPSIAVAALIAAVSGSAPGAIPVGYNQGTYPDGAPLTFWGVVTLPRGHVLTAADVDAIMGKLTAAGFFRDDIRLTPLPGNAELVTRAVLTAAIGRQWDDQLAIDIQRQLLGAGDRIANVLPDAIGGVIGGVIDTVYGLAVHLGQGAVLAALVFLGAYFLVKDT